MRPLFRRMMDVTIMGRGAFDPGRAALRWNTPLAASSWNPHPTAGLKGYAYGQRL